MKIQISTGWKIIVYLMSLVILLQFLDVNFKLMNTPDSFVATVGVFAFGATVGLFVFILIQLIKLGSKLIKELEEQEEKEDKK